MFNGPQSSKFTKSTQSRESPDPFKSAARHSTIVGVLGDVRSLKVTQTPQPEMYQPLKQAEPLNVIPNPEPAQFSASLAGVRQL